MQPLPLDSGRRRAEGLCELRGRSERGAAQASKRERAVPRASPIHARQAQRFKGVEAALTALDAAVDEDDELLVTALVPLW
mgnify:CR=1 FL=1